MKSQLVLAFSTFAVLISALTAPQTILCITVSECVVVSTVTVTVGCLSEFLSEASNFSSEITGSSERSSSTEVSSFSEVTSSSVSTQTYPIPDTAESSEVTSPETSEGVSSLGGSSTSTSTSTNSHYFTVRAEPDPSFGVSTKFNWGMAICLAAIAFV